MNNQRNNRRRGRGNRPQQGGNQSNRIDSRARGNAPQMLDKYKKLAQDAQHHGDRVQTEYYLQFADHYFRVIADNKARQDEARGSRDNDRNDNDDDRDDNNSADGGDRNRGRGRGQQSDRQTDQNRQGRRPARGRDSDDRYDNDESDDSDFADDSDRREDSDQPARAPRSSRQPKSRDDDAAPKRTRGRPRKSDPSGDDGVAGEIDASVLPPAISAEDRPVGNGANGRVRKAPAPRARRKPSDDSDNTGDLSAAV